MKIFIIAAIILLLLYFVANTLLAIIKGEERPGLNGFLVTVIMVIAAVFSFVIGKVPFGDSNTVKVEEKKENKKEKTEKNINVQTDNKNDIDANEEDTVEGDEPPVGIDDDEIESYSTDSISIDPISDVKIAINSNEDNAISFENATIDQFNGSIQNEEQEDSYDFIPEIDGVYRFEFSNIPNNVSHSIYLYNSDGEELDRNTSVGNESGITANLESGQKYIVSVKHGWNTGSYTLNIGHQKPLQVISEYSQIVDSIQFRDQENDYIFVPEIDGLFRFEFSEIPNNVYHSIYVYNSGREELDRNTSIGNESGITIPLKAGQEYHIVVKQSGNIGSYKLLIGKQKPTIDISEYTIVSDSIQYTDQENIYVYIPKNDGRYRFEFANVPNDISHSIYIYNSGFEELDRNTSIGNENGLSVKLNANEIYHVAVKQSSRVGSYDLLVGSQKEILDISKYANVNDSVQFTEQQNIYTYIPNESRDVAFTFFDIPEDVTLNLYIYNSKWEELDKNTSIGNESGIVIPVNEGSTYYIVVEQSWNYGSYLLNIN